MVQTPVGARCPTCARLYKLPTYQVPALYYLRATGIAIGAGVIGGLLWWVVNSLIPLYLSLVIAPALGYAIGELISLSVNRKRGMGLAVIAGAGVAISYLVTILIGHLPLGLFSIALDFLSVALGVFFAVNRLR